MVHHHTDLEPPAEAGQVFGAYDGRGIWGAGHTHEQARIEAEGYFRDSLGEDDTVLARQVAGLAVLPIAPDLLHDVVENGAGFDLFDVDDGVLVRSDEPYRAYEPYADDDEDEEELGL